MPFAGSMANTPMVSSAHSVVTGGAAIRLVKEFSAGMNLDLSAVIDTKKIVRHGLGALDSGESPFRRVEGEHIDNTTHLAQLVTEFSRRIEGEMTRSAARINTCRRWSRRREHSGVGVEMKG